MALSAKADNSRALLFLKDYMKISLNTYTYFVIDKELAIEARIRRRDGIFPHERRSHEWGK
jgi:hypothetical protein